MTELVRERWPVLAAQISAALGTAGEPDLAVQLDNLAVVKQCVCDDDWCQSFYTAPLTNGTYGPGHRNVVLEPPWPGLLVLDVVEDRIVYIEVLDRPPLD
ncbi:MAG TPA: hypothetical protein VF062_29480 [Candidatus Limnocylindrales bacterium]